MAGPALEGSAQPHNPAGVKDDMLEAIQHTSDQGGKAQDGREIGINQAHHRHRVSCGLAEMQGREALETVRMEMEDVLIGHHNDDNDWEDAAQYNSRRDKQTWQQRVPNLDPNWWPLLLQVIQAYLQWKHSSSVCAVPTTAP
ncbi:hypothetical protein BV20DRAFT_984077 [Pilatotrama ljubarskyi]|nr:hypothetical protein BV20DRAFT_984077 [Pilatotrama ljubarskyi]